VSTEGYRHWPAFDKLSDLADESGLQVRLRASDEAFAERPGEERRQLTRIELWLHGALQPMATAPVYEDDIEAASLDLLQRVA
jgi:hypothetical protein